jgi:PAS domain S-box-containing protein
MALGIVLNSKHPMLLAWGPDLICFYNDAYRPILGARHPEALGQPVASVFADIWPAIHPLAEQALSGEGAWSEDLPLVTVRNGAEAIATFTCSFSPVRDESGAVAGLLCACMETTAKVAAEEALRQREQRLCCVLEGTMDNVLAVDRNWQITYLNQHARDEFAGDRNLLGQNLWDTFPQEVGGSLFTLCQRVMVERQPETMEGYFEPLRSWYEIHVAPSDDGLMVFSRDITRVKQKATQIALQASLLDAVEQAVMATDLDGKVIFYNRFAETLYGWTAEEAMGRHVVELTSRSDPAKASQIMAFLTQGGSWSGEFVAARRDGSTFPAYVTDSPIFDTTGRQIGIVGISRDISQEKAAERELKEKTALLETTLENMDQGLMVMGADGRISQFNRRALDLLELPLELMEHHPHIEEVSQFQATAGDFALPDNGVLNLSQSRGFLSEPRVYERTRRSGTVLEVRTVPLPDGAAVRTYTDITARRRAEAELRTSEGRYRALVDASATIVWRATRDGHMTDGWGWQEFTGQAPDAYQGYGWSETIHFEDSERINSLWTEAVRTGQPCAMEFRILHVDGEYRWVLARGVPLHDANGAVQEWVGTLTDIHEQKESEARLILRDRSLAAISQSVVITDARQPDSPIIYVNPAFERHTGYAADEAIGRNCRFLQGPGTDRKAVARIRSALAAGSDFAGTLLNYRKDGTSFVNELTISPVRDQDGSISHFVGVQSDVTDRQRLEEQLRQSQKMEAVGQLTGGLAHDFNNLLTVILGNAEVLNEEPADAAKVESLSKIIIETAERGAELTKHLLAFGRRQALKPSHLRLGEVVHGIIPLLQRTLGEHVELRTEFVQSAMVALVDRTLLESAILNLAVNARDAMPKGGTLTIRTGLRGAGPNEGLLAGGQDTVFITVSDTGTGIAPEVLNRVFEPFFTTKEVGKGSGLGLSMVYGFAQQSGGHVSIKSKEGEGTAVTIVLPAVVSQQPEAAATPVTLVASPGKERVLVVEDAPQVLQFVSAQLLSLGYEVTAVADGPDAVALLRKDNAFDVLFTDIVLPRGMSGVELARAARAINPDLKIVYTSGYAEEVFQQHGRIDPDIPLLRKPYRRKELADVLRSVLDRTSQPQAHR